nr:hypothetical protein [Tanacetum cinerariifolium]
KAFFSSQWKFLIHTILQSLSAKRTSWIEFSTSMASAVIWVEIPLFENRLEVREVDAEEEKVGTSHRIKSSEDLENVFNRERVNVDIDEGIELVVYQEKEADTQEEIYNIDLDHSSKVLSMQEDDAEVVAASTPIPAAKPAVIDVSTHISAAKPAAKPKVLKIVPAAPAVLTRKR